MNYPEAKQRFSQCVKEMYDGLSDDLIKECQEHFNDKPFTDESMRSVRSLANRAVEMIDERNACLTQISQQEDLIDLCCFIKDNYVRFYPLEVFIDNPGSFEELIFKN